MNDQPLALRGGRHLQDWWDTHRLSGALLVPRHKGLTVDVVYEQGRLVEVVAVEYDGQRRDITALCSRVGGLAQRLIGLQHWLLDDELVVRGTLACESRAFRQATRRLRQSGKRHSEMPPITKILESGDHQLIGLIGFLPEFVDPRLIPPASQHGSFQQWGMHATPPVHARSAEQVVAQYHDECERMAARDPELAHARAGLWVLPLGDETAPVIWSFVDPKRVVVLRGMHYLTGRLGTLIPRALIDTVEMAGRTFTDASFHHASEVTRQGVALGDRIVCSFRNGRDLTVHGIDRRGGQPRVVLPTHCPACDDPLSARGADLYCLNPRCGGVLETRLAWLIHILTKAPEVHRARLITHPQSVGVLTITDALTGDALTWAQLCGPELGGDVHRRLSTVWRKALSGDDAQDYDAWRTLLDLLSLPHVTYALFPEVIRAIVKSLGQPTPDLEGAVHGAMSRHIAGYHCGRGDELAALVRHIQSARAAA